MLIFQLFICLLGVCLQWINLVSGALPPPPSYIFTRGTELCVYNGTATEQEGTPDYQCFLETMSNTKLSLEFDYRAKVIYISANESIYKMNYTENAVLTKLALSVGEIQDFTYDWISGNLIYVDKSSDSIFVVNHRADHAINLIKGLKDITGVAVAPIQRYIFWTKSGYNGSNGAIGRCALDGSNRNNQLFSDVASPHSIAVDHLQERVYWTDSVRGSVESIDMDGKNHKVLTADRDTYPFSLTIDKEHVIWISNFLLPEVYWTNKTSGSHVQYHWHFTLDSLDDIVYFGEYSQPPEHKNGCSDKNGGCSQICFAVSDTDRTCQCSFGFYLADDGTSCQSAERGHLQDNLLVGDAGRGQIYFYNVQAETVSALDIPPQTNIQDVACDPVQGKVFWSNLVDETIESANLDGSDLRVVKSFPAGHSIVGLALDHTKQLLFYCDIQADGVIASVSYTGTDEKDLFHENYTVAIVPDVKEQHLYFAVFGRKSRIARMNYDGSGLMTLVDNLAGPLSLAVDFMDSIMYWFERSSYFTNFLEWSDLNGDNRGRWSVHWSNRFLSLAVIGDYIYVAEWDQSEDQLAHVRKGMPETFTTTGPDDYFHISRIEAIPSVDREGTTTSTTRALTEGSTSTSTPSTLSTRPSTSVSQDTISSTQPSMSTTSTALNNVTPQKDDQSGEKQSSPDDNTVSVVAGIAGAVVIIVILAIVITACIVYRRRKRPSDNPIVTDTAFENPSYGEVVAHTGVPNASGTTVEYSKEQVNIYQSLTPRPNKQ